MKSKKYMMVGGIIGILLIPVLFVLPFLLEHPFEEILHFFLSPLRFLGREWIYALCGEGDTVCGYGIPLFVMAIFYVLLGMILGWLYGKLKK